MTPKHTVFLDLEASLEERLRRAFLREFKSKFDELQTLLDSKDFGGAREAISQWDLQPLVERNLQYARQIGMSALLLGASRLSDLKASYVYKQPPIEQLEQAINHLRILLARNATIGLRADALLLTHAIETDSLNHPNASLFAKLDRSQSVRMSMTFKGKAYFGLASSIHISRLSAFGFLAEATKKGITEYQVSAVLDDRTCPVCEALDGYVYPVEDGMRAAMAIMGVDDVDTLKSIAPFPKQKESESLKVASLEQLIARGYHMPPYHPLCRCILLPVPKELDDQLLADISPAVRPPSEIDSSPDQVSTTIRPSRRATNVTRQPEPTPRIASAAATLWGTTDPQEIADNLYGRYPQIDRESRRLGRNFLAGGLGAILGFLFNPREETRTPQPTVQDYDRLLLEQEREDRRARREER